MTMNDSVPSGELFLNIVSSRRSMRDFKPELVPRDIIESVFGGAQRAPSNCNTQPWFVHVVTGETLERLRAELPTKFAAGETALAFLTNVIRPTLGLGDNEQLMFGMSFGYPTDTAVNEVRTERAALEDVVTFHS